MITSRYSYNGMNLRVAEYDSGSGQHDLINDGAAAGSSLLIDHNLTARTVAHVYTPGIDQRDGLGGALHLMGVDALGTVRAFINDDGGQAVTDTQSYDGYGITRSRTGGDWMSFGFAGADGYQTDPNQLMLLGNREYHPFTRRFLTRDPAGAGDNDYEYCDDNPIKNVDPSGLWDVPLGEEGAYNAPQFVALKGVGMTGGDQVLTFEIWKVTTVTDKDTGQIISQTFTPDGSFNMLAPGGFNIHHNLIYASILGHLGNSVERNDKLSALHILGYAAARFHNIASLLGKKDGMDYATKYGSQFDALGNFNAGMVAAEFGYSHESAMLSGGYAQFLDNGPLNALGNWQTNFDDPYGQTYINLGYEYAQSVAYQGNHP